MNRIPKRISLVALTAAIASVAHAALFAPSASAAENTWVRSRAGFCLTATSTELSSGRWLVRGGNCTNNFGSQLWDRRGSSIYKAHTNQCLDSNFAGEVYYMECNGGDHQKWHYLSADGGVRVRNVATGRYLTQYWIDDGFWGEPGVRTFADPAEGDIVSSTWSFYGGT